MRIQKEQFVRTFEYKMKIGTYPAVIFNYDKKRYLIVDTGISVQLMFNKSCEENEILSEHKAITDLIRNGYIEDANIDLIWDNFDFEGDIVDYMTEYAYHDWVHIVDTDMYGVISEMRFAENGSVVYMVNTQAEHKWLVNGSHIVKCKGDDLEYDLRQSSLEVQRDAYQWFLDRIEGV